MQLKEAQQAKFGPYEIKWTGDQLMFYVNGKLQKAIDVDANSFGMSDFKKTVKKIAAMKKMEDELPFSIMAEGEEINEKLDFIDDEEAGMDYEDLEDKDIDNDGDEDSSDKYLHHKLGTTAKKTESVNESYGVIDPRGNTRPVGSKIQGDRYVKGKKGHYVILMKHAMTARRAIEKAGGKATSKKIQDLMYDLRFEGKNMKEAAPKMKVYSWEKNYKEALKNFDIAGNIMKMKSSGGHSKVKKDIEKVRKAMVLLMSKMKINSSEF